MPDDLDDEKDAYVADTFGVDPASYAAPAGDAGGGLLAEAASALSSVADSVQSAAAGVIDSAETAVAGAYGSVSGAAAGVIDTAATAAAGAYGSVSGAAAGVIDTAETAVAGAYESVSGAAAGVIDTAETAVAGAYESVSGAAAGVIDTAETAVAGAYGSVSGAAAGVIDSVEGALSSAYDSVSSVVGGLVADAQAVGGAAAANFSFSPTVPPPPSNPLDPAALQAAAAKVVAASAEAEDWIRTYLAGNTLSPNNVDPNGATVMFGGKSCPLQQVVDTTVAAGRLANLKLGANDHITADTVRKIVTQVLLAAMPRVPTRDGHDPRQVSLYIQYTFTPTTVHLPTAGGPSTSDQPAHTLTGQMTFEYHAENQSGLEVSLTGSATWFADDKGGHLTNQSGFTGVQVAWVWSFLDGAFQAGPQFQALAGASRAQQTANDKLEWAPTGQISAGGQVQYAVPGLGGHVLIGLQAGVSGTAAQGAGSTVDFAAALTFTYKI